MPLSLQQLAALSSQLVDQPTSIKVLLTFGILLAGYITARILGKIAERIYHRVAPDNVVEQVKDRKREPAKIVEYLVSVVTIGVALIYLNSSATSRLMTQIINYVPSVMTAVLVLIGGLIVVKLFMNFLINFIDTVGFKEYIRDLGFSAKLVEGFFKGLKLFLYLVVFEVAIIQLGVSSTIVSNTITAASYGFVIVIGLLAFFGFKDLVANYAAGLYLRGSDVLKPGKKVKIDDESGEIRQISALGTTITTDTGYFMLAPNRKLMDKNIFFKRVQADVETLEDIKDYFVAQEPSYCGPASAEMALSMFGFDLTQGEVAEDSGTSQPGGVKPDELMDSIERLTNGEVKTAFIEHSKITGLSDEFKTWFNDGALIIPNFAKPVLFPNADTAHYSLAVGVEGEEILVVDPSTHTSSGGVYYVDDDEMLEAMKEWEDEEKGYIVLAPKGTTAYWRIKEDLIYSDTNFYEKLSKSLELQLSRIMRRGRILKNVMPDAAEDFLEQWRRDERVKRLWKAERQQDDEGDRKLDEFTGSDE